MHTLYALLLTVLLLLSPISTTDIIQPNSSRNLAAIEPSPIIHIERVVDQSMDYELNVSQNWQNFPELYNIINLQFGQHVGIKIRIGIYLSEACRMKMRLMVDGVESKVFRREVGQTKYIVFVASQFLWMAAGKHTLQVDYIKTGKDEYIINDRINMAMFKLDYLQRDPTNQLTPVIKIEGGGKTKQKVYVEPKYPFKVLGGDIWYPFPDLKAKIYLLGRSQVTISYKTMLVFSEATYMVTKIMINNKEENTKFRNINGVTPFTNNEASHTIILQTGNYEIRVQYRTPGKPVELGQTDWSTNFLQVTY